MPWLVSRSHVLLRSSRARVLRIFLARWYWSVARPPASASHCHRSRRIVAPQVTWFCPDSSLHPGCSTLALPKSFSEVRRFRNHIASSQVQTYCYIVCTSWHKLHVVGLVEHFESSRRGWQGFYSHWSALPMSGYLEPRSKADGTLTALGQAHHSLAQKCSGSLFLFAEVRSRL